MNVLCSQSKTVKKFVPFREIFVILFKFPSEVGHGHKMQLPRDLES